MAGIDRNLRWAGIVVLIALVLPFILMDLILIVAMIFMIA